MSVIKKLRKAKKISQCELARTLDVTQAAVSKWENGENLPALNLIPRIADALGADVNELLRDLLKGA